MSSFDEYRKKMKEKYGGTSSKNETNESGGRRGGRSVTIDTDSKESKSTTKSFDDIRAEMNDKYGKEYSKESKDGWQKFLDDREASTRGKEDETFWEKIGRYLSGGTPDTSLPMGTTSQVINDLRVDESYKMPNSNWSYEQKYAFGELYLSDPVRAYAYAEEINKENDRAKEEEKIKDIQDSATDDFGSRLGHTIGAIATSPLGMADFLNTLAMANAGREIAPDGNISPFEYSQAVKEAVGTYYNEKSGTLDERIPIIGGKGSGDVYGLGTSIVESAVFGKVFGSAGTLVSYFGQGAASGVDDALSRGASEEQAVLYGTALGAFEGLAEMIGIDNLFKIGSSHTLKEGLKNVLRQAGAEGLEEGLTSALDNIADVWIMKDKSNFNTLLNQYIEQGMSESEAKWKVFMDSIEGIAYDTLGGFVSGGVHAGVHTGVQTTIANRNASKTYGDGSSLVAEALEYASEESDLRTLAEEYSHQLEGGKKLSGSQINMLDEAIATEDKSRIRNTILKRLGELGETSEVDPVADALVKHVLGEKLSAKERNILNESKSGYVVEAELNRENIKSGGLGNDWASHIGTRRIHPESYNKELYDLAKQMSGIREAVEKGSVEKTIGKLETAARTKLKASESGKTIYKKADGSTEDVSIKGIVSTKGGLKVELDNGKTVRARDLSFSTSDEALMYEMVARMDVTPDTANEIISTFKPANAKQASLYFANVPLAYQYGTINYEAGLKNIRLSEAEKRIAFNRGKADAVAKAETKSETKSETKTATKAVKTTKTGIIYEGDFTYDEASANELQKASMAGIEVINKLSSLEVHVFESVVENGERVYYLNGERKPAPNGYFRDGNKIYIDFNAGNNGEGAMLYTMSHEVTHYIREWNEKGFKALGDFLIAEYGKKGVPVNALIEKQKDKIKARYKREGTALPSDAKLFDVAYEEMVSDAMSDMFADPKAYEKLAKLKQKNRSLWKKLGEAIKSLLDKLKTALGIYMTKDASVAEEALYVRDFAPDVYDKLQDLYIKAFVEADANYEAAKGGEEARKHSNKSITDGNAMYSDRYRSAEANSDILSMIEKVESGNFKENEKVFFGIVSDTIAERIHDLTGVDVRGFKVAIEARQVKHILKDHGEHGLTDKSMANPENIAKMEYTLNAPDDIREAGKTQAYTHIVNGRNRTADTVLYEKEIGEKSYYVVQAVPDTKAKMLYIVTAFIGKKGYKKEASQLINAKSLDVTAKTGSANAPVNSISEDADFVKRKFSDRDYLVAVVHGDMETAQRMVDEAANEALADSKIRNPDGSLRTVYHGTNTGEFTVFNSDYIGMSSGDDGFFGMGFYFAYSKGEAKYYGAKRIISAYLDLKNPFDFEEELQRYKGEKASGGYAPDAVALMNFADKFPEISQKLTIGVVEKGNDAVKEISFSEFSKAFKDVIENKTFEYAEVMNEYGETETLVTADPTTYKYEYNGKKHSYIEYSFQKRFWGKPNKLDVAYEYLSNSVYEYVDMIRRTRLILDNNKEFTAALKAKGYDGAIQSKLGDEAVAFYPEQIKSADPVTYDDEGNVIPLSERFNAENNDIRYSEREIKPITEAEYKDLEKHFGVTSNFRVAGYLLPDGKMLDFSGKHWGDDMSRSRQVDHRDVQEVLQRGNNGIDDMVDMIGSGSIRLMPEIGGINLATYPNEKQRRVLSLYIRQMLATEGQVIIDYDAVGGDTVHSRVYEKYASSSQILGDIRNYFNGARQSDLMSFHTKYSDRDKTSYAPTFYSHMGKVIDDIRIEKMGAGGVVSYLKGKGVKDEEIKWSGIEAFLEGKKSVTKAELQEFVAGSQLQIVEQMSDDEDYTRWSEYKLEGGSNYRELVFQMPNSSYSNNAMRVHWGHDAEGVIAHARIQDMITPDGKKMLFIEEIQSDWHNEGAKDGYADSKDEGRIEKLKADAYDNAMDEFVKKTPDAPFRNTYHEYVLKRLLRMAAEEGYDSIGWTPADIQSKRWNEKYAEGYRIEYDQDIPKFLRKYGKKWGATVGKTTLDNQSALPTYVDDNNNEYRSAREWFESVMDSHGYSSGGHEVIQDGVTKRILSHSTGKLLDETLTESHGSDTVWSMDFPDSMTESVLYEGQVMYSDRDDLNKAQSNLRKKYHIDPNDVIALSNRYLDNYTGKTTKTKMRLQFLRATEHMAEIYTTSELDLLPEATKIAEAIASDIEQARTTGTDQDLVEIKRWLRSLHIQVPTFYKAEFERFGGIGEFRKRHMGKFILSKDGKQVDTIYPELQYLFGKGWFPDIDTVPDQLIRIAEVSDMSTEIDLADYDFDASIEYTREEIISELGNLVANSINKQSNVHIDYRDSSAVSHRTLLANALDSTVQSEIERNKLSQYKAKIALIESEQAKLDEIRAKAKELRFKKGRTPDETKMLRDLDAEATQIANRISTYDKQLLNLESTTALKNVLEREKAMLRRRLEQKSKESLKAHRERAAKTQRELMNRYQESREKAIEGRHKTEIRHKIKNVVSDLNKLLLNPTKDQHVPIGLQLPVAEALDAINMDTMNAEERVAYYNDLIAKSSDPDEIAMLTKKRDFFEYRDANFKERITALKNAYAEFKESDDPLIRNAHNDAIEDLIKNTADAVGNKSLKDMSLPQLEAVYNMYKAILATVRNSNKMFKEGRQETVTDNSEAVKTEVREVGGHKDRVLKITKFIKKFGWEMLKPITAMKAIGSKTFASLFDNVRAGEDTWAVDVSEAKQFYDATSSKYGYDKWDFKKRYTFKDSAGTDFSLSLEQIMSLYAYSKREQADKHLEFGGFIFDEAIEVTEKNKLGIPLKYEVNDANPYRLRKEDLMAVTDALTNEQKGFIDEMQTYLSEVMGAKGNEVSLAMYDIKLYTEKNYFPLKTSRYFREFDPEKSGTPKIKNSGFSKKTVPQAGNPIVLSNFMDVWATHVNDMSMYHAFVLPLEDFLRVYNYSSTAGGYDSVQQYIKNAYGSQANQYIERLMDDLNGGARTDSSAGIINRGLSLFKKASTFASASVVVQQPSAIARALAYINPKYFVASTPSALNLAKHKTLWAEVKKYAPVAIIKEMGYFDTGVGRSTVEWLKGNQTVKDKVDDALSKAPAMADELVWVHIWEAVKRETAAKNQLKPGSEDFLKECGRRFTEVITNTQVYDSVLSRSGMMRSKDTGMKMATAFMAEPTTTVNMMVDGILQGKRGNKKFTAATVGAISASVILNSILVALVYAARDDDEDETYLEKYLGRITSELLDGFNPLTYIPFVKDIWSIAQGYDVERSDMSVVSKLWESIEGLFDENTSGFEKVTDATGAISSLFGIPLKNLIRDAKGMYNLTKTILSDTSTTKGGIRDSIEDSFKSSIPLWDRLAESDSKTDKLYDAIMSGDTGYVDRIKKGYKDTKAYETAIRKALRENDPRIKEAAQADISGDVAKRVSITKAIIAEGHFSQDTVVAAINAEISAIKRGDATVGEETEDNNEVTSMYKPSDINVAFDNGDDTLAHEIIDDLIDTKVANGKTAKEAKSSVRSSMTSYWKPLYKQAYQSGNISEMERIRRILYSSGLYGSSNDVVKTAKEWLKD